MVGEMENVLKDVKQDMGLVELPSVLDRLNATDGIVFLPLLELSIYHLFKFNCPVHYPIFFLQSGQSLGSASNAHKNMGRRS